MHVAGTGFDDRHFGVAHDGLDQTRSSSRHEHVDMASRLHHGGGTGASVLVDGLHQCGFETVGLQRGGMTPNVAALVRSAAWPPRSSAALPDLRHRLATSTVTFGRAS